MKRSIFKSILAIILLFSLSTFLVVAADSRSARIFVELICSSQTANCDVEIAGDSSSDSISATIKLLQGTRPIKTWNVSSKGNLSFEKTVTITSGKAYKLTVDATINGTKQPTHTDESFCLD